MKKILLIVVLVVGCKSNKISNINSTFHKEKIPCGDILSEYATKPKNLEFISCKDGDNFQRVIIASYRVKSIDANDVENFLMQNYGMSQLKYMCCGWENKKSGSFINKRITAYNKDYVVGISMYSGETIYKDKEKIPYFYVKVTIWKV